MCFGHTLHFKFADMFEMTLSQFNTGAKSKLTFEPSTFQSFVLENYNFDTSVPQ